MAEDTEPSPDALETSKPNAPFGAALPARPAWDPTLVTASASLLQKLIWPGLLIIVLLLFKGPITTALQVAATAGGTTIDVAGFKIMLPKSEIPSPPDAIKSILPQLDPDLIANIVSNYGGHNRVDTCYESGDDDELKANSVKGRLNALGLIKFEKEAFSQGGKSCLSASMTTYNHSYDLVRAYLIQVISSVKFSQ